MRFGIYLGYSPEQPLENQGIGRLIIFLITASLKKYPYITIACPSWHVAPLLKTLAENEIDLNRLKIITTKNIPIIIRFRQFIIGKIERRNRLRKMLAPTADRIKKLKELATNYFINSVVSRTWMGFAIRTPLLIPIVIGAGLYFSVQKIVLLWKKAFSKITSLLPSFKTVFSIPNIKSSQFLFEIYETLRKREFFLLNQAINEYHGTYTWYVPSLFWPEVKNIRAKKLIAAPDLVYLDFPNFYASHSMGLVDKNIKETLVSADKLICYSDYVKEKHLISGIGIDDSTISIISHGWIDLSKYLLNDKKKSRLKAKALLREWFGKYYYSSTLFRNFDIGNTDYFFYSSQHRPHKNLFNLVKAYEYVLRRKYINTKLILTARITDPELLTYIKDNALSYDIIELYNVPTEILASLNALAICAVNPSYFEGGFPFTFSEAYSVGTPSIMSDIPVVREVIRDPDLVETMLFDPTDYKAIADKMVWVYSRREELLALQESLANKLRARTWEIVADEYFALMESL